MNLHISFFTLETETKSAFKCPTDITVNFRLNVVIQRMHLWLCRIRSLSSWPMLTNMNVHSTHSFPLLQLLMLRVFMTNVIKHFKRKEARERFLTRPSRHWRAQTLR